MDPNDDDTNSYELSTETTESQRRKPSPLRKARQVSQEQLDRATGCYIGSAYDEMGLSPAARCLYFHLVRRANGAKEREVELWRAGKLKRTASEGIRSLIVYLGLSRSTILRATRELEQAKLITVDRGYRESSQERETNTYILLPPRVWCTWLMVIKPGVSRDPDDSQIPF
jgi:hypothetical protein